MIPLLSMALLIPLMLVLATPPVAQAQYAYTTIDVLADFPGTHSPRVTGLLPGGQEVGTYTDKEQRAQSWLRLGSVLVPLYTFTALDVAADPVTGAAIVCGAHTPHTTLPGSPVRGFRAVAGTVYHISYPRLGPGTREALTTEVLACNATTDVGGYRSAADGINRAFAYEVATNVYTTLPVPGALGSYARGISDAGVILVRAQMPGNVTEHYLWTNGVLTLLTISSLAGAELVGYTDTGFVAANVGTEGRVWDGTTLHTVAVPGATLTALTGIRPTGTVYGYYLDAANVQHGFIAVREEPGEARQPKAKPQPKKTR